MPILDTLARDHRNIEKIAARLGDLPSTQPDVRIKTFARLQSLLQAHARAEEEVVYRRLRQRGADEQKTLEAYEEHRLMDILLQELASACPGGRAWAAKVKVLEEVLRHHIKEEELMLFPLVSDAFDSATRAEMHTEFEAVRFVALENVLGPFRRLTPAVAGRATITLQGAAGRYVRRAGLTLHRLLGRGDTTVRRKLRNVRAKAAKVRSMAARPPRQEQRPGNGASMTH